MADPADPKAEKALDDLLEENSRLLDENEKLVQQLLSICDSNQKKHKGIISAAKGGITEIDLSVPGLVRAYQAAVKDSNGLVSVEPRCIKLLQSIEKRASRDACEEAAKAIKAQVAQAKKAGSDPKKRKDFGAFEKQASSVVDKLEAVTAADDKQRGAFKTALSFFEKLEAETDKLVSRLKSLK